jgi:tetratricopeptide (TPR) repeat protein
MEIPNRVLLTLSVGLFTGALVHARPISISGQGTATAGQNDSNKSGQQSSPATQVKPGQPGQPAGQTATGPVFTPEESKAYQAISSELSAGLDFDKVISLSEDFVKKFPNSSMLSYVYTFEATAYQQKGDINKTVETGEKSVKLNPDNLMSLIILAGMLPQPQLMQGSDLDKQKKLTDAEADASRALQLIDKLPKLATETDDQLKKRKDSIASEPHGALGMIHLQRATMTLTGGMDADELAKAAQEFKQSVVLTDHPSPQNYYRLGEAYSHENKLDDAIAAFSKASEIGQGSGIQQYADQQIEALKKRQAQAKPPTAH